ncbi:MAG: Ig-like domain-containing protein [Thermoclostridium sp.]|nr:Ig-like domain-containing protein [Thermoclostridium sp.]
MKPENMNPEGSPQGSLPKKNKKVLIIAVVVAVVLVAAAGIYFLRPTDRSLPVAQDDLSPTPEAEIPTNLKTVKVREQPVEAIGLEMKKPFELVPEDSDETGTATDSGYRILLGSYDYTAQELTNKITITPQTAFTIKQGSSGEFLLQPSIMKANQIYSISFSDTEEGISYSWAFQTRKEFYVVQTTPRDKATYVPVNTGIEINFSHKAQNDLSSWFEITPRVSGRFEIHQDTVAFVPDQPLEHDTIYTIKVKKGYALHSGGMELKEDTIFAFQTEPVTEGGDEGYSCESFEFSRHIYNFFPYEQPLLSVYTNIERTTPVEFSLYRYGSEKDFKDDLYAQEDRPFWCVHYNKPISTEGKELVLSVNTNFLQEDDSEGYYGTKYIEVPQTLPEGHYVAVIKKDEQERHAMLQVNDLAVYVGAADNKTIAMIYESESASPVEGVKVVFDSFTMQTGKDGLAVSDNALFTEESSQVKNYAVQRQGHPSHFATMGGSYYSANYYYDYENYYGYANDFYYGDINDLYWGYLFTDRDMYMPSDTVNIWGMLAGKDGSTAPGKVRITLSRGYSWYYGTEDYALIDETEVQLTGTNTFNASFSYEDISQGSYTLEVFSGDQKLLSKVFSVNKYVKPIYSVTTGISQKNVMLGEKVEFTMDTKFFEGTPVNGMNFDYYIPEIVGQNRAGTLTTDDNGHAALNLEAWMETYTWQPQTICIQVSNADTEQASVNAYENLTVFPRDIMIRAKDDIRGNPTNNQKIHTVEVAANKINIEKIRNKDWYLSEEYTGDPVDMRIQVELYETWYTKTQIGTSYNYITKETYPQYEYDKQERLLQTIQLNTIDGKASFEFTQEEEKGYYAILRCEDSQGREIVQEEYFYKYYYSDDYYDWRQIDYYHIEKDQPSYSVNEQAVLSLYKGETPVIREANKKVLFMLYRKGLVDYMLTDEPTWKVNFQESYMPNAGVKAVYFDGKNFKSSSTQSLQFDYQDRELKINVTPAKKQYRPGETAIFDVEVTDAAGKPRKAEVLFSVVDEAFFALYDQSVSILYDIYNQNVSLGFKCESIPHTNTLEDYDYFGGAECGEGGDDGGEVRSDFKDTAKFESVMTDENGHGQITVMLPDNLTQWRVTYLGITEDLYAGDGVTHVNARLPYFINTVFHDMFIEGDKPVLQMCSFGTEVKDDARVEYTVRIDKDGELWMETNTSAPANQRAYLQLEALPRGSYTYTVSGKYKDHQDAISLPFQVYPGFVEQTLTEYQTLGDNTAFPETKWPAKVYFINENVKPYWNELLELAYSWNNRIDSIVVRKQAKKLLQEYFKDSNVTNWNEEYDTTGYQLDNGGIALLPYDSADPVLTAKICSLYDSDFDYDQMVQYFNRVMQDAGSTSTHIAAAYWGLACLREPVLLELNALVQDPGLKLIDRLYIALAYAYAGDVDTAGNMYHEMVQAYMKEDSLRAYITMEEMGYGSDDIQEATSLCALLAQKVNGAERDKLFEFVKNMYSTDILTGAIRLNYIKSNLKNLNLESSFTWELDGKKETVTIKGRDCYSMFLTAEKLQNIHFSDVKGKITVSTVYSAPIGETAAIEDRISITRTYSDRNGNIQTAFDPSEYVKITLNIHFEPTAPTGHYMVEDYLPASLRHVYSWNEAVQWGEDKWGTWYPHEVSGQKVSFCIYHRNDDKTPTQTISYYARVTNLGEFTADYAAVYNLDSNLVNYAPREQILVK